MNATQTELTRFGAIYPPQLTNRGKSNDTWSRYDAIFQAEIGADPHSPAQRFRTDHYLMGALSRPVGTALQHSIENAPFIPYVPTCSHTQFLENDEMNAELAERVNHDHQWYDLQSPQLWCVWDALDELETAITAAFERPWRTFAARAWRTNTDTNFGMNGWHTDGCPSGAIKLMLYLTELGTGGGGIQFRHPADSPSVTDIAGPAGTWLLFHNSQILHRGVGPTVTGKYRVVVEVTLGPAIEMDIQPRWAGFNIRNPHNPWIPLRFEAF